MFRQRLLIEWLIVAAASMAMVSAIVAYNGLPRINNLFYDRLLALAERPAPDDVLIVAIDNASIAALGHWPWRRDVHAALLEQLAAAKPRAVVYDVLFTEPAPDSRSDARLGAAMRAAGAVFVPLLLEVPGENGAAYRLVEPVAPIGSAARGVGHVDLAFDEDGIVRYAFLEEGRQGDMRPHLMELLYRELRGAPSSAFRSGTQLDPDAQVDGLVRARPVAIPYAGPPGHFRTVPFVNVLRGEVPREFIAGKVVMIGATASGLGDLYPTPRGDGSGTMPGVEVHANILDGLLSGRAIRPAGQGLTLAFSLTPLALLLSGFLRLSPRSNLLLGLSLAVAVLVGSALLMAGMRLWVPPGAALAGLLAVYPLWGWRRLVATNNYMREELLRLSREPDLLPKAPSPSRGADDVVGRHIGLLEDAIARVRELRRLVSDGLHSLPDATLLTDAEGLVLIANGAADRLFGMPAGRHINDLLADLGPAGADAAAVLGDEEIELMTDAGASLRVRRAMLGGAYGVPIGWIVRLTDVSALRAAERQREEALELLTHDMRSPQNSILTLLQQDSGVPAAAARRIAGYARRTLELADGFVQLARAESASYTLEEVDLSDLLVVAADDLWPQAKARNIAILVQGDDREHLVMGDRSLLTRVLINLISNAVKFSPDGAKVICRLGIDASQAYCAITDHGTGIAPEQIDKLFRRFARLPNAATRSLDGAGLGLAFVHTVVKRHGGAVECKSRPGEETTFTIRLPLAG